MTFLELKAYIDEFIYTNGSNDITAATLNPVLQAIADWANGTIGSLDSLATTDKSNAVNAINELKGLISAFDSAGIQLHSGTENPNTTPPATYGIADFYIQVDGDNNPIQLYQYNGALWTTSNGGDLPYIPIDGTAPGAPVTGSLEVVETAGGNLFIEAEGNRHDISFGEGGINIRATSDTYGSDLLVDNAGVQFNSDNPGSRGIRSDFDFTPNITDFDFTQKKYVDDAIAAGGGGGIVETISGTTNEIEVDSTDPANVIVGLPDSILISSDDASVKLENTSGEYVETTDTTISMHSEFANLTAAHNAGNESMGIYIDNGAGNSANLFTRGTTDEAAVQVHGIGSTEGSLRANADDTRVFLNSPGDVGDVNIIQDGDRFSIKTRQRASGSGAYEKNFNLNFPTDSDYPGAATYDVDFRAIGGTVAMLSDIEAPTSIVGIESNKSEFDAALTDGDFLFVGDVTQYTDAMAKAAAVANTITDGVTDVAPSQNAVFDALALKANKYNLLDYSAISTVVGWSAFTTKQILITETDSHYVVYFTIEGTSDNATTTFTLPFTSTYDIQSVSTRVVNTSNQTAAGLVRTNAGSATVTLRINGAAAMYGATGNKSAIGQIIIPK